MQCPATWGHMIGTHVREAGSSKYVLDGWAPGWGFCYTVESWAPLRDSPVARWLMTPCLAHQVPMALGSHLRVPKELHAVGSTAFCHCGESIINSSLPPTPI